MDCMCGRVFEPGSTDVNAIFVFRSVIDGLEYDVVCCRINQRYGFGVGSVCSVMWTIDLYMGESSELC